MFTLWKYFKKSGNKTTKVMPGTPLAMAWAKAWREVQILRSSGAETWQGLIFVSQKRDINR